MRIFGGFYHFVANMFTDLTTLGKNEIIKDHDFSTAKLLGVLGCRISTTKFEILTVPAS